MTSRLDQLAHHMRPAGHKRQQLLTRTTTRRHSMWWWECDSCFNTPHLYRFSLLCLCCYSCALLLQCTNRYSLLNTCATCLHCALLYIVKLAPTQQKRWETQPCFQGQFTTNSTVHDWSVTITVLSVPPLPATSTLPSVLSSLSSSLYSSPTSDCSFGYISNHTLPLPPTTDSHDLLPSYMSSPPTIPCEMPTVQPPFSRWIMSHEHVPNFAGTGNDKVQPSDFIKIFGRQWGVLSWMKRVGLMA